jgi:hypothetical protein
MPNSALCHGANLEGQPNWRKPLPNGRLPAPPHDRTGHTWHHSDKQLFDMVKNGTAAMMPGYETDMPASGTSSAMPIFGPCCLSSRAHGLRTFASASNG